MATVFLVQPARYTGEEAAFAEALVALRLALGALEAACDEEPARRRRATAALRRFRYEVESLAAMHYTDEEAVYE